MQIQFLDSPEFAIDTNGILSRRSKWLITVENFEGDLSKLAQDWAGKVGDPWRTSNADGSDYVTDDSMTVTAIYSKVLDSRSCIVTFEGSILGTLPENNLQQTGSITIERRKDQSEYKTITYILNDQNENQIPHPGDLIDWAGSGYRCESLTANKHNDGRISITITAVNTSEIHADIISENTCDHRQIKTACWLVNAENLEEFTAAHALHTPAAWAGSNYYVSSIKSEPANSARRYIVTVQARYSTLQLLEVLRSEEILGVLGNTPINICSWSSLWRAGSEDQQLFETMLGSSAEEWTGDSNSIVCKISPRRISDCEYEYTLEARYPEDIGLNRSGNHWQDADLPERIEYYTRVGEIRFTPRQCGYRRSYYGNYRTINNWNSNLECPLNTGNPLPVNMVDQPMKLLEIVEVSYLNGTSSENLSQITSWFTGNRVSSETLAGITGSFLRYDLDVDDITDKRNRKFTRISKIYRLAPSSYSWNHSFWV